MKKYEVIRDYQGGDFGMGRQYTALEWLEQATEWRDADDSFGDWGDYQDGDADTKEKFVSFWTDIIKQGREKELIDYIAEMWQLEFKEVENE